MADESRPVPAVGDRIVLTTRPFISTWEVTQVTEHGIVLRYANEVKFVGYDAGSIHLPGGSYASEPNEAWLGAAHWPEIVYASRVTEEDGS